MDPGTDRHTKIKNWEIGTALRVLGGRAAEKIRFDHLSTGAADDISRATEIARSMVMRYGMEANLGHVTYDTDPIGFLGPVAGGFQNRRYSEETAREIDCAVRKLVNEAHQRAVQILESNQTLLEEGARQLLAKETLSEAELKALFQRVQTA